MPKREAKVTKSKLPQPQVLNRQDTTSKLEESRQRVQAEAPKVQDIEETPKAAKPKKTRQPSAYNNFMKEQIPKLKEQGVAGKDAFKKAAERWREQKNNTSS